MAALLRCGQAPLEKNALRSNDLLLWLSARREGSWQQFRAAVEELYSDDGETWTGNNDGFPLHQQIRLDLDRLAHVEFFARDCEKGWRVAPPMLAAHPVPGGVRGVLCGARSPALGERVLRAAENIGCEMPDFPGVPKVIRLVALDAPVLNEAASKAGVHFQPDAPLALLSHLPPCDRPLRGSKQAEFPVGVDWDIHKFDESSLAWRKTDRRHALSAHVGIFRFLFRFQRPRYFLRWKRSTFELPRAIAIYTLLRRSRRDLLSYNASARTLRFPAICRPPQLLERTLVLCSGLPPVYVAATASLTYADVPMEIASFAAELLCQPLR